MDCISFKNYLRFSGRPRILRDGVRVIEECDGLRLLVCLQEVVQLSNVIDCRCLRTVWTAFVRLPREYLGQRKFMRRVTFSRPFLCTRFIKEFRICYIENHIC